MKKKMLFYVSSNMIEIENLKTFKIKFFEWLLSINRIEEYNLKDWVYCRAFMSESDKHIPINFNHDNMMYKKDFSKIKTQKDIITYGDFFNFVDYVIKKSREQKIEKLLS